MSEHRATWETLPDKRLVAEVYAEVARRAALDSSCTHFEDLATQALSAIEGAEHTFSVLWEKGVFK